MKRDLLIADMRIGDEFEGFYLLKDAVGRVSSSGKPFLSGAVSDRSGEMGFKVWDYGGPIGTAEVGKVIKIRGSVGEFKGAPQITVSLIREANANDAYSEAALVPVAPIDPEERMREIEALVASMSDPDYRAVAQTMLERHRDALLRIPAAKSVHHGFLNGLLMHTSNMLRAADMLAELYQEVIDRDLLLAGTLLHDFAKEREFSFTELGVVADYSTAGQLLGHLVMGAQELARVAEELHVPEEKSMLLQHMILSHHGEPEFGAAVRPMCAEAELLSYIDRIDSRMEIYAETYADMEPGEVSERIFALEKRVYKHR